MSREDTEGVIRVTTGDSRKGRLGVIFVFSVCIHVCIFGRGEIECYLSIQGMYGYITNLSEKREARRFFTII